MKNKTFLRFFFALLLIVAILTIGFTLSASAAEEETVYVSDFGNDEAAGTVDAPLKSLYAAFRALSYGGKIVVCGPLSVASAELPSSDGLITITSIGDEDYRASAGGNASLIMSGNIIFKSAFQIENLDIVTIVKNTVFICGGNYAKFGTGITTTAKGADSTLPSLTAGCTGAVTSNGTFLEVCSGDWFRVRGGARGTNSAAQDGDTCLVIRGGTFNSTFDIGGDSKILGDANLYVFGGIFNASINGATAADVDGDVNVSFYGGTFTKTVNASRGGKIGGNAVINIAPEITVNTNGFTVNKPSYSELNTIKAADEAKIAAIIEEKMPDSTNSFAERNFEKSGTVSKTAVKAAGSIGDIDGDGKILISDVITALKLAKSGEYNAKADIDASNSITAFDCARLFFAVRDGKTSITPDVTANIISDTLALYGATANSGMISSGSALGTVEQSNYALFTDAVIGNTSKVGLYFGCDISNGIAKISGYYFEIDAVAKTASVYSVHGGAYRVIARRNLDIVGTNARLCITCADETVYLYFTDNVLDPEPFAQFNLSLAAIGKGAGVYTENATASLPVAGTFTAQTGTFYTNSIFEDFTDPEIYFDNGRYYIYGTQASNVGVKCYSTTNFRIWKDEGNVLTVGSAFGDSVFKAANIVKYGDYYYIFYMAKSNALGTSVTACASAMSPTGPFTNSAKTPLTSDLDFIGGQPFVDEDGQVYLIYTRTTGGNKLYGSKVTLNNGTATIDLSSEKLLLKATEPWENAKASVVECGYIVKHKGLYYLLYSGGNYNSTYGTGYATSDSPLGTYTKYAYNPVLTSNDQAFGVGAATVFTSPDGSEHFIAYLRNFSPTVTRPLCTCVDRIKFVADPNGGIDRIAIGGPTVTKQFIPSGLGNATITDYQPTRFIW